MTAAERFVKRMLGGVFGDKPSEVVEKRGLGEEHGDEEQKNGQADNQKVDEKPAKTAQDSLYEALVADESPKDKTLAEHDKERHPNGFNPETDTCKFREELKKETETDKGDEVDVDRGREEGIEVDGEGNGKKPLVSAEEDAEYLEAVKKGDMETAAKMVREVAGRAFPNTKVVDEDGLPKIVFHNSDSSFTVPSVPWEGPIEWEGLPGLFFADREQPQYGRNKISCFVNLMNPLDMNDGDRNFLHGRSSNQIDAFTKQYEDAIKAGEKEFEFRDDGVLKITPKGMSLLKNDGYFGEHPEDEIGKVIEYAVMSGRQVKSADPVTYDDDGNVIPLSRRFDDGDDIRGDVSSGKSSSVRQSISDDGEEFGDSFYGEVYPDRKQSYSSEFGKDDAEDGEKASEAYRENFTKDGKYKSPFGGGKFNRAFLERAREGKGAETGEVWDDESRAAAEAAGRVLSGMLGGVTFELSDKPYGESSNGDSRKSISGIFTGTSADYANESRQGGVGDGPSLQKIGSGEGSQVYGWGLYGSNQRGVAETYADETSGRQGYTGYSKGGRLIETNENNIESDAATLLALYGDLESAKKEAEGFPNGKEILKELSEHGTEYKEEWPHRNIYEQTFFTNRKPGDESHLINWYENVSDENNKRFADSIDKLTVSDIEGLKSWEVTDAEAEEDLETIKNGLRELSGRKGMKGEDLYQGIVRIISKIGCGSAAKNASKILSLADIDGIKYPVDSYGGKTIKDGNEAGWNYVSFRDDNIRVDHKWVDGEQRFFRNSAGKVVGEYNRSTNQITLYPGAKIKDVVHEYSHGLWQFAEQEAKAGRDGLQKKLHQIAHAAPEKVKEAVGRSYYDQDPNVVLEECFTHEMARRSEKNKAFAEAIKTASGKNWYKRAWGAIKDTWKGFASKFGFNKADTSRIDDMTSGEAADYILTQMAQGKKFGNVSGEYDSSTETRMAKESSNSDTYVLPSGRKIPSAQKYLHTDTKGNPHDEMWSVFLEKQTGDGRVSQEFSDVVEGLFSGKDIDADTIKSLPEWKKAMEREKEIQKKLQETHGIDSTVKIQTEERERFRDAIIRAAMSDHISKTVPIEGTDSEFETNEGLKEGESYDVEKGRNICIVIGLPAAGKSTSFANPLAKKFKARLCDSDTIKKVLPEFNNGYGGNLVHEESTMLNEEILNRSIEQGDNIVYPILGYKPEKLEKMFKMLRDKGYKINLCLKDMPANIAKGRLLGRFLSKGRYLPIECITKAQGKFADCFERVKGLVDAYVRATSDIDGSNERIIEKKGDLI